MSKELVGSPAWHHGRRGEILQLAVWRGLGLAMQDISGTAYHKPPMILLPDGTRTPAMDMVARLRSLAMQMECKTKTTDLLWNGGLNYPEGWQTGIELDSWEACRQTERDTQAPVILSILSVEQGVLRANTLTALGEPRISGHPDFRIINWPVDRLLEICRFDPKGLALYFKYPDGRRRDAPVDLPSDAHLDCVLRVVGFHRSASDLERIAQLFTAWHAGQLVAA